MLLSRINVCNIPSGRCLDLSNPLDDSFCAKTNTGRFLDLPKSTGRFVSGGERPLDPHALTRPAAIQQPQLLSTLRQKSSISPSCPVWYWCFCASRHSWNAICMSSSDSMVTKSPSSSRYLNLIVPRAMALFENRPTFASIRSMSD